MWISALEALEKVEGKLGRTGNAKGFIAEWLWDGRLVARAGEIWRSNQETLGKAYRTRPADKHVSTDVMVERRIWRSSKQWQKDQRRWRWDENEFHTTRRIDPRQRYILKKIEFSVAEVERMIADPNSSTKKGKGGRKPETVAWHAFWHALIKVAKDGRLTIETFPSIKSLREELLAEIDEGLSDHTIKTPTRQVYRRFINAAAKD